MGTVLAAIDVGTNAVRLELARVLPDGSLETLREERDPIRPGESLFATGVMPEPVLGRLVVTLRRYGALCRRYHARVRAVATSAVREARNHQAIIRRVRTEAGVDLDVVSGKEEARLICLGVLHDKPRHSRSLCIDIGGGSTEVAFARGEEPASLWSIAVGSVRVTEVFRTHAGVSERKLRLMREYVREALEEVLPPRIPEAPSRALGSSGAIRAVVAFASNGDAREVSADRISKAVRRIAELSPSDRKRHFDPDRGDIIVASAVILDALMEHLRLSSITAVDRGLRDGVLVDLLRRLKAGAGDRSLAEASCAIGRRFSFDEKHAVQVARLAVSLFEGLKRVHRLPPAAGRYLEAAALLHDIGHAVGYHRHHKHSYYLIQNADIPGLTDREREIVARIARFHRRSPPDLDHPGMEGLAVIEMRWVRKLATLLRVADALDRSHHQAIDHLRTVARERAVTLHLDTHGSVDLELWDAGREARLFQQVFGRRLVVDSKAAAAAARAR
ncbi:MAG: Ppx/GppA phosphatase family protein [Myxococcota bacterium]